MPSSAVSSAPRTLVTGLEVPWAVAFLPDGAALVTERESARLLRVTPDGTVTPVGTVAGVVAQGEGGLMGVAVSPGFAADRAIVVAYTSATDNRVVRLRVADGRHGRRVRRSRWWSRASSRPASTTAARWRSGRTGCSTSGRATPGGARPRRTGPTSAGRSCACTADGAPAPGNPFGTAVYSIGHRNVQGLAFAPDGTLYAAEFGQNRFDEVNRITAGGNYGWPEVEGVGSAPGSPTRW